METLLQDVRHAARTFGRQPAFTAAVLLMLAFGIGATTAIFSVVHAVLLRPLPYPTADRLARVAEQLPMMRRMSERGPAPSFMTSDTFKAWRESTQTLEGLGAYGPRAYTLTGVGEPVRLRGAAVSASLLAMLRVAPERGRLFEDGEDRPGSDGVAVISHRLWEQRFQLDPAVVGRIITLDGRPVTIKGVLPAAFYFPDHETEIWTPFVIDLPPRREGQRLIMVFGALALLKPGASPSQAAVEGTTVAQRVRPPRPPGGPSDELPPPSVRLVPLQEEMVAGVRPALLLLLGAVGFVFLIATANIANLLLAQGAARRRELAVRSALGAGRGRIVRQLLTENILLGLTGGLLGVFVGYWMVRILPAVAPDDIPRIEEVGLHLPVLGFTFAISVVAGLLVGLPPTVQGLRSDPLRSLGDGVTQAAAGFRFIPGNRSRSLLVTVEVALALVLLIGAGLLIRSFGRLVSVDPGYEPAGVLTAQVSLPDSKYASPEARRAFWGQLIDRVRAMPGVEAAATTSSLPLLPGNMILSFRIDGEAEPANPEEAPRATVRVVTPGYVPALGLRLLDGRDLSDTDREGAPAVVLANESLARQYLDRRAVGRRLRNLFGEGDVEVVGVVGDVRHEGLDRDPSPELYVNAAQLPSSVRMFTPGQTLVIRTSGDPLAIVPQLRTAVRDLDPDLPLDNVMTMAQRLSASVAGPRFYALLLGVFAALALMLAVSGIYGVLAYTVAQRRREIGVRMALGAGTRDILTLVLRQGLLLVGVGAAVGLAAALALGRLLTNLLFGVAPTDSLTYGVTIALLGAVAVVACALPARRASRVDPVRALRYE